MYIRNSYAKNYPCKSEKRTEDYKYTYNENKFKVS